MKKLTARRVIRRYKAECLSFFGSSDDVNQVNFDGDSPLHIAVLRSDYDEVLALLEARANPNCIGDMGYTPLHYAKDRRIFDLLIEHGAEKTVRNEFGTLSEE